jgi:hypothetical protein
MTTNKTPGKWTVLMDGDNLLECREISPGTFQVIEVIDMVDACGRDADPAQAFVASLSLIDLDDLSDENKRSALSCVGLEDEEEITPLMLVEACHSYGFKAPLGDFGFRGAVVARRAARRAAKDLLADGALDDALDRPVNKIGSSAREFMRGDFASAMQRGAEAGDPSARLMAKMHGIPQEVIDDARPKDFLPFVVGYTLGMRSDENDATDEYAPEYTRGFERGVRVRKGEAPAPSWIK